MDRRNFVKYLGATTIYIGATSCGIRSLFSKQYDEEISREAWGKLANKGEAFKYVGPDNKLPNVLIYGDSISIGYTPVVRKELEGKANVYRIFNNGMSSHEFISKMEKLEYSMFQPHLKGGWDFEWDVIHFNVGLHDLKYVKGGKLDKKKGNIISSIGTYKKNLDDICEYLQSKFPGTKLIFATTTPVPENASGRYAGDAMKYNDAALEVLQNYPSIVIDDLYNFTLPNHQKWMIKQGNVHYNTLGKTEQGKEVAKIILEQLNE